MYIKKFLKDNVDWKFFNFLVDATTDLEDKMDNLNFNIDICLYLNESDKVMQFMTFTPRTNKFEYSKDYSVDDSDIIASFNAYGFNYYIELMPVTDDSYILLYEYFDKVKHRCRVIDEDQFTIKVQPL